MSALSIHGLTVSVDFGDKSYGNGNGRFFSVSSKIPDDAPGVPLNQVDDVMKDGIDLYFTAWQTAMQTRFATGEIDSETYKAQTMNALVRIQKVGRLWAKIKNLSTEQLEAYLSAGQQG